LSRRTVAVTIAVALGLAGCGGSGGDGGGLSADAYGARLHALVVPLFASLKQVSAAQSSSDLTGALHSSQASVEAGIKALSGLEPPSGAQAANDELLSALRTYEATIEKTRRALENGSTAAIQTQIAAYNTQSRTFGQELIDVKQKLDDAGIQVGAPSASTSAG
jgi:ABC-type transporter Mla subunit MlaD